MENNYKQFDGNEGPGFFCVVYQNFNPDNDLKVLILEDGTRITSDESTEMYTFFDYYQQFYKDSFIEKFTKPHIIYTGVGSIRQFETMQLTDVEIEYLNKEGLYIFLYESLIFELGEKKKFYITENKTYRPITYHLQFEITDNNRDSIYSFELESITCFVKNNRLTSVTVLTCEYDSKDFFKEKYKDISFGSKDIFVQSLLEEVTDKIPTCYQHNRDLKDRFSRETIIYKFWCTNWRYDTHRHFVALYLADKSALLSWSYKNSIEEIKETLWFDFDSWKQYPIYKTLIENDRFILDKKEPFVIDLPVKESTSISLDHLYNTPSDIDEVMNPNADPIPINFIEQCFCAVITESAYAHPLANFTEKTITIIKSMRPFVMVAPPRTLEYLQKLGFKTFSDVWDESYDKEMNHEKRLLKIFELLEWLNSKTMDELKDMYDKLLPVLQYNFNHLTTIKQSDVML